MPEGHTLHRLADLHNRRYAGRPVAVSSPQGRFTAGAELIDGRVLESAEAYGKHLFHSYGPDLVVHIHLGLHGRVSASTPRTSIFVRPLPTIRSRNGTSSASRSKIGSRRSR